MKDIAIMWQGAGLEDKNILYPHMGVMKTMFCQTWSKYVDDAQVKS